MLKRKKHKPAKKGKKSHNWISNEIKHKLLKLFVMKSTATLAAREVGVSRPCVNRWFNHFRESIYQHSGVAPRFSGEVEVDVTQFNTRSAKVRKYWRDRDEKEGGDDPKWYRKMKKAKEEAEKLKPKKIKLKAIAIMQRGGKVWSYPIEDEKTTTLLPIIHMVIEEGSTIYTDATASLKALANDPGYIHKVIDHSREFSDGKGTHINSVEQFFSSSKVRLRKFRGLRKRQFILHLKECEFRYNHRDDPAVLYSELKRIISP